MGLFTRKKEKKSTVVPVQTAPSSVSGHPFKTLGAYLPLMPAEMKLYRSLREAVPVIDAAIGKIVRLTGGFKAVCSDKAAEMKLERFLKSVPVNGNGHGINSFLGMYLESLLTYGTAVGEVVTDANGNIYGLYNANLEDIEIRADESPMKLLVCTRKNGATEPVQNQELIMLTALSPKEGSVYGTSILSGLPFVSDILLKIFNTIGTNWERVGNVRYAVTYTPSSDNERNAREHVQQIAQEWSKAMSKGSEVSDFIAAGDVSIKVIGADNCVLDSDVPVRQMLEQIIAKLSIPPFLLGLSWSTTERMSSQQADILTSELEYYRELLNAVVYKVCHSWLAINGYDTGVDIVWNDINLQDEVEGANARYLNAKAAQIEANLKGNDKNE